MREQVRKFFPRVFPMVRLLTRFVVFAAVLGSAAGLGAQSVYELRKLTEEEWLAMSTEDRLRALSTAYKHERNQNFLGQFGRHYDLYKTWGYEFYEMEDRYESYAFRGYEAYNILEERRRRWSYNEFGDRIAKMRHTANIWREVHSGDETFYLYIPFDYINTVGYTTGYVDGVWVAREGTDDWAISVIGAGALRTKFTPLTLSLPNVDGVSIDFQSANNSLKLVTSAYMGHTGTRGGTGTNLVRRGGVMLRGGRFRRKFGVLTLGATYATVYGVQGNRQKGSEWRGTIINDCPTPIMVAVRFLDDSPEDREGGPVIYEVRLKVNGKYRDDILPEIILDDVTLDRTTAITEKLEADYLEPKSAIGIGPPDYDFINIKETIFKYTDFFYLRDLVRGNNIENIRSKFSKELANSYFTIVEQGGKPLHADGTATVNYVFDLASITEKVNRIEAVVTVANDYRIQTAMIYTLDSRGGHDRSGKEKAWYSSTYWRTAAQAEGNIKDGSNIRTMSIDFGYQVASIIYGFDADFNYRGFKLRAEYVTNSSHYMFADGKPGTGAPENIIANQPPRTGHRWSQIDHAYYVTAAKDWEKFGFAGEIFKLGKFYRPYLDYFYTSGGGWRYAVNTRNNIGRIPLIEDNDDEDMYPDTMFVRRTLGFQIYEQEDPDGVFPGNDADNDGLPDNNRNNNRFPDYDEPFLMFDVDPDEFIFGNDYNNNTIPDFREDDMKMDTPYDLQRQGRHFYLRFSPMTSIDIVAGSFRTKGVGVTNRTNDDYFKFILNYDVFDVGKLYAEYRHERIQDNIRDPYIQVDRTMNESYLMPGITATLGRYERELYFDELEYRNSKVNRLFLDSRIRAVPAVTLENHVKFERNYQIEGNMYDKTYQPRDILTTIAMVNKIVYTKRFGNWVFSPGVKFRFYKKMRSESLQPLEHYMMRIPILMLKYIVSQNTDITLGMQGIPWFYLDYNDYVQTQNDFNQKTYTLQIQNKSNYFGYNIWGSVGFTLDQLMYDEIFRRFEEYKSSIMFVKINLGW